MLKLHLLKRFNLFTETEVLQSCLRLASQVYLTPKSMLLTISHAGQIILLTGHIALLLYIIGPLAK